MKIRIPRKKKKWNYKYVIMERSKFPYISKTEKFYYFLDLEYYIKNGIHINGYRFLVIEKSFFKFC
jgi:hypothetical protein